MLGGIGGKLKSMTGALKSISGSGSGSGGLSNLLNLGGTALGAGIGALGGIYSAQRSNQTASNINMLNYKQAKEFAQNQIQWRVSDAKKAGLHPLAALGMAPVAAPAGAVGGDFSGIGTGLMDMGQNISRAVDAYQTRQERAQEQAKADALAMARFQLDSREVASRIAVNEARAKALLDKSESINIPRSLSVNSQPRNIPIPRVSSRGKFVIPSFPDISKTAFVNPGRGLPSASSVWRGPKGKVYVTDSPEYTEATQNTWGIGSLYRYLDDILP